MDVEQRSGQLYNSEISSSFIGPSISNSRHMNQFVTQKSKFQKLKKSSKPHNKLIGRTPGFESLPKIETNKSTSPEAMTQILNQKSHTSNSDLFTIADPFQIELPISETVSTNNVQHWLQMPNKIDSLSNNFPQQNTNLSTVSSESEDMLTRVGEFTDRTSVTSSEWGDDVCEFDKKESHRVNQMFEEIEWMLFNDGSTSGRLGSIRSNQSSSFSDRNGIHPGPTHLKKECNEWTHQFPHFRLIGHQVSLPQEQGYMFHESEMSGSITPKNSPRITINASPVNSDYILSKSTTDTSEIDKISLVGNSIKLDKISQDPSRDEVDLFSSQEEVFAADGEIVEIIAIDYKMDDEDFNNVNNKKSRSHNSLFRSHKGFPPITPNAVIRDAVLTAVFDNLWSQVVEWILPLLTKIYQSLSSRDMLALDSSESSQSLNMIMSDVYRNQKPLYQFSSSISNLDNILKISTKTLQYREKSYLHFSVNNEIHEASNNVEQAKSSMKTRKSSIPEQIQNNPVTVKGSVIGTLGNSRNPLAMLNFPKKSNKVIPILDRSLTPLSHHESSFILDKESKRNYPFNPTNFMNGSNSEHLSPLQCLRGKALYNCPSPDLISRCGTLPHINSRYNVSNLLRPIGSRIGSAQIQNIHNQSISIGNNSISSHILMTSEFSSTRPCTSQTARSDLVGGHRSSTPNGTRRSLNLNVHGSSIAMNSFSVKATDELAYENFKHSKARPYWKIYNNPVPATNKRNKSMSNSVK